MKSLPSYIMLICVFSQGIWKFVGVDIGDFSGQSDAAMHHRGWLILF